MKKCQVFILFGQSNAVGHSLPMKEEDKIKTPLKNVFGLSRKFNQSFDIKELVWERYVSSGMNLGEEQDDTYSIANCLATLWQKEIDSGKDLPELYIIHIAIGAEGVTDKYLADGTKRKYMWNPHCEKRLIPGRLWTVDISLYQFSTHILSLLNKSFKDMEKEYEIISLYWRGGENDIETPVEVLNGNLKNIYNEMFLGFYNAVGKRFNVIISRLSQTIAEQKDVKQEYLKSLDYINKVFYELEKENDNVSIFDVRNAPFYNENIEGKGIVMSDLVHYTAKTNFWCASEIIKDYLLMQEKNH